MGWLATLFLIYGSYLVGDKNRNGFLFLCAGNLGWAYVGFVRELQWDLIIVSLVFVAVASFNYWKWSRDVALTLFNYEAISGLPRAKKQRISNSHSTNGRHS